MPTASNGAVELHYDTAGSGPTIACLNPAGYGAWCWSWLVDALAGPVETLVWDYRGTGRSDASQGPLDAATLAEDLETVLSDADARRVHLVGAGLGGMVALQYDHAYDRAATLSVLGTTADGTRVNRAALERAIAPRDDPVALRESLRVAFSDGVVEEHPDVVDRIVGWRREDDATPEGWRHQIAAMQSFDRSGGLFEHTTPAVVCHGRADALVPWEAGEVLAEGLPNAEFAPIDAGHLVAAEEPALVEDELTAFLTHHVDPAL